ncbi:hypothetical protein J6590_044775, partial [Homalodisca vitripennis]
VGNSSTPPMVSPASSLVCSALETLYAAALTSSVLPSTPLRGNGVFCLPPDSSFLCTQD